MSTTLTRPPVAGGRRSDGGTPPAPAPDGGGFREAWPVSAAVGVAVILCSFSLHGVIEGWSWLAPLTLAVLAGLAAATAARRFRLPAALVPAAGVAGLALALAWIFCSSANFLGVIPTFATVGRAGALLDQAGRTIVTEVTPVVPSPGVVFLVCAGIGLIAVLVDTLAATLKMPATSGVGLFAVMVIPAVLKPNGVELRYFTLAAVGFLLVLGAAAWQEHPGRTAGPGQLFGGARTARAAAVCAAAVAAALVAALVVPGFSKGLFPEGSRLNLWSGSAGLNPVVTLGNDLRRPTASGRITYATNSGQPVYLRSTTLEDFSGSRWAPALREEERRPGTALMLPAAGPRPDIPATATLTQVSPTNYASPWLLAPYAAVSVSNLPGTWSWDPQTMTVKSGGDTELEQRPYQVRSLVPQLTRESLQDIRPAPAGAVDPVFTTLPEDLPGVIGDTAATVAGGAARPYDKALAIQSYLRGPDFSYSLEAPVEGGYDGNGMQVLSRFLEEKSGYCVHFAAAMAVMARAEGIPSRIALGYAPGRPTNDTVPGPGGESLREFAVDSRDAHAWPELYFEGAGWIRFEPTPSRGAVPAYALQPADSVGADVRSDEMPLEPGAAAPVPEAPAPAATTPPAAVLEPAETGGAPWLGLLAGALVAAAAVLTPWGLRRRRSIVRRRTADAPLQGADGGREPPPGRLGPAALAWDEAADVAQDYGFTAHASESARAYARRVAAQAGLPGEADTALMRLCSGYEGEAYGASAGSGSRPGGTAVLDRTALLWGDVDALRQALHKQASRGARLRARFFPASLATRFRR